jgi:ABC-2 type transport system ATP-binding protein
VREVLHARGIDTHDGSGLPGAGHILLLTADGEETYDLVRDIVADLGLGLVRMEQRRHHISEVFKDADDARDEERKEAVGHGG